MLSGSARDSAVAVYSLANRSADDARARVLLQGTSRFEGVTALRLGEQLGLVIGGSVSDVGGKEEAAALMLDVYEKGVYSQGLDLHSYRESRGSELSYLKAFLSVGANAADRSNIEKYFGSPLSQMYGQAKTEWDEVSDVLLFSADKPGIYQRLNPDEQSELINRIAKDGEVSAYLWAYRTRRDIFRSPDFVPQGMPPDGWKMLIKNPGRIPIQ
jgi:hypothetical protein